jgi:hypothetical protein
MTSTQLRPSEKTRPLVVVVCAIPLLGEAMRSALEFADVQTFAARAGDLDGLLRWLRPDALIVDTQAGADEAVEFARERDLPVLHLSVQEAALRLYRGGVWQHIGSGEGPTPEEIRNVVAGALFARAGAER